MNSNDSLNLQILKKGRLKEGDVFAMLLNDGKYVFGRVIGYDLPFGESPFGGSNLIYIYDVRSDNKNIDSHRLTPNRLLLPPMFISKTLWTNGYAVKVSHADIQEKDLLKHHCFSHQRRTTTKYFDEKGNEISKRIEPCGEWLYITNPVYIDNAISDALGVKRAPLQEKDMWYISGRGEKILLKKKKSELKKYSNYEWIIKNHPEVIDAE